MRSFLRSVLASVLAVAVVALVGVNCGGDSGGAAPAKNVFKVSADPTVDDVRVVVVNPTNRTVTVNLNGPGATRSAHTLAPGANWEQILPAGQYNYSAKAEGAINIEGGVTFAGKNRYVWTITP